MANEPGIEVWGAHTARTFRAVWTAEELGLAYLLHPIGPRTGETQTDAYTQLNRKQKIPFLVDGEVKISESVAIARYLIAQYGNDALSAPTSAVELAKEDEWCCYAYGELDETSLYVVRRHRDLAAIYGKSETVVAAAFEYVDRHLAVIESHLEGREFLMDRGFGLADIIMHTCLSWAEIYGSTLPPAIQAYVGRIAQRPAYTRAYAINYPKT